MLCHLVFRRTSRSFCQSNFASTFSCILALFRIFFICLNVSPQMTSPRRLQLVDQLVDSFREMTHPAKIRPNKVLIIPSCRNRLAYRQLTLTWETKKSRKGSHVALTTIFIYKKMWNDLVFTCKPLYAVTFFRM